MTTTIRNEAAERLRARWDPGTNVPEYIGLDVSDLTLLDQALAAERRATVERIRDDIEGGDAMSAILFAIPAPIARAIRGRIERALEAQR